MTWREAHDMARLNAIVVYGVPQFRRKAEEAGTSDVRLSGRYWL